MNVLIVHDSRFGNGKEIAKAIAQGLRREGYKVDVVRAREISTIRPTDYDAFVLGCPTRMGGPTFRSGGAIKYIGKNGGHGKPYTTFSTCCRQRQKTLSKMDKTASKAHLKKLMDGRLYMCTASKGPLNKGSVEDAEAFGKEIAKRLS
jgi:menaquinone-dependent protoporphyrinogen IX oxidase